VLGETGGRAELALLASAATLMGCWTNIFVGMLQGELAVPRINRVRLLSGTAYVARVVGVFVTFRSNRATVIASLYVASLAVGAWLSWRSLARPGIPEVRVDQRTVHRFALRAYFTSATPLTLGLDYVVVALVLSAADLGHYAVASSVSTLPIMILAGVGGSLMPRMASLPRAAAGAVMRRWLAAALVVDLVLVAMMEAVVGPAIKILFGPEFVPSISCARPLIVVMAVLALRIVVASAVQAQGRGGRGSLIDLAASAIMVPGMAVGAARWGVDGAALGYLVGAVLATAALATAIDWSEDR
jgi:O-antigen/teichoic acid export membrane protein